jgi:type I restriction enzyme, R subunit
VVRVERLRRAVARINPQLSPAAVQRACDLALTTTSPSVIEDHRSFHELLPSGVPVAYADENGDERHEHARLVDFDDLSNNEFVAARRRAIRQLEALGHKVTLEPLTEAA